MERYSERMEVLHKIRLSTVDNKAVLKEKIIVVDTATVIGTRGKGLAGRDISKGEL